jgi:hypothetical protein
MSEAIFMRWLKWNARGEGKDRSSSLGGQRYRYIGPILYSHDWPVARLVKDPDGNVVCLTKSGAKAKNPPKEAGWTVPPRLVLTITVTDVGAFSKFEADVLDDDKLHERMKWLCHLEAQTLIDTALEMSTTTLAAKPKYRSSAGGVLLDRELKLQQVYAAYTKAFRLKWPAWPPHYRSDLSTAIQKRREEYNDPAAVEKRERAAAKKAARKAFDIDA